MKCKKCKKLLTVAVAAAMFLSAGSVAMAGGRNTTRHASVSYSQAHSDFVIVDGWLREYVGSGGDMVILDEVVGITDYVFAEHDEITSVTIPKSVVNIGAYQFFMSHNLTKINVDSENPYFSSQDGVYYTKDKSFLIAFPSGRKGTFTLHKTVTNIVLDAFYECAGLTEINVESGNTAYSSQNSVLYNKDKTELIYCPDGKKGAITIPDSVKSIDSYAFFNRKEINDIKFPDSLTSIGEGYSPPPLL